MLEWHFFAQLFSSFNHLHPSLCGRRWKGKGEFGRARGRKERSPRAWSRANSLPLPFRTPDTQAIRIHAICSNIDDRQETERGCVTAVQFILFNFANYSPSIVMELKVSKEITGKWQNQRSETNKYVSWALFLKLQAAGINFEKLLGWTVFKNPNFNPFQSSSVLPIRGICCICCVILTRLPLMF